MSVIPDNNSNDEDIVIIDRDDINNYNPDQILPVTPAEIEEIRKWIHATQYAHESGEFRKHLGSHMPGTNAWVTTSALYASWLNDPAHGLLWIKGIPGSGKSVVAAHIIDALTARDTTIPVLYFFSRQIIDANHEPVALLRDWLDQILVWSPPLQQELKQLLEQNRSLSSVSMDDLWAFLRLALANLPSKCICVADALDEIREGNDDFLRSLAKLGIWRPDKVKVLITSRPVLAVEQPLRGIDALCLRLEETSVDKDISAYVERSLKRSGFSGRDQDLIRQAVPGHANGIFLYARLAMNSLLEPGVILHEVLQSLPTNMHEMYTKLLQDHAIRSGVPTTVQLLILQCVTHASRPLRLLELADLLVGTNRESVGDINTSKHLVRAATGPLLEILPNETVCVIHHSFSEYLTDKTRELLDNGYTNLEFGAAHGRLAYACIQYLRAGCLDDIAIDDGEDSSEDLGRLYNNSKRRRSSNTANEAQQTRLQYPFFAYAAENWHLHVVRSSIAASLQPNINLAIDDLFAERRRMSAWLKLQWDKTAPASKGVTALHIASRFGMTAYASHHLATEAGLSTVDTVDSIGRTPLWWAASSGHAELIQILVESGANPDADCQSGLKPLHRAATLNHAAAVQALLNAGVDPLTIKTRENPGRRCGNAPRTRGHTALMYACQNGHLETLEVFLPFLTDTDVIHRAIAWSANTRHAKLVKRLLQHPDIDPNAKVHGETLLCIACKALDSESAIALLESGADPSILSVGEMDGFAGIALSRRPNLTKPLGSSRGFTALHALCSLRRRQSRGAEVDPGVLQTLFELLLERGAPLELRMDNGRTALHDAVGSSVLTRLLLLAGADANAVSNDGRTPLHGATSPDAVTLLVEEGRADVNKIALLDGKTPLACMIDGHHRGAITKLLEYRPDVTIKDPKGNGPLHLALGTSIADPTLVEALLKAGADPNERNHAGNTPLLSMHMGTRGSMAVVDMLIQHGANIDSKDTLGMTLLSRTVRNGWLMGRSSHSDIEDLLSQGADLRVRDDKGRSLLHQAVAAQDFSHYSIDGQSTPSRLDYLLTLGLDLQVVDYRGNSLMHELAMRKDKYDPDRGPRYNSFWQHLQNLGINVNQENYRGRTAFHILSSSALPFLTWTSKGPLSVHPFDFVLAMSESIEHCDSQGLTALHIASTVCEAATKKLLDAGANPTCQTFEGLTPLHLAARARQPNIVGMLLDSGKYRDACSVNLPDKNGNTALHYACRSGRPETVQILLNAGADATNGSLWLACAEFEEEEKLWNCDRRAHDVESDGQAGGLFIEDQTRPGPLPDKRAQQSDRNVLKQTTRLEEIIGMLLVRGCDTSNLLDEALSKVADYGHEYTFACLIQALNSNPKARRVKSAGLVQFLEEELRLQQEVQKRAARESPLSANAKTRYSLVLHLLKQRQYHVIPDSFHKDFSTGEDPDLDLFVRHGYASLLDQIGGLEADRYLHRGKWHAFGDEKAPGLYFKLDLASTSGNRYEDPKLPLIFTALRRDIPNMDVVSLLVEKFRVDVSQHRYAVVTRSNTRSEVERCGTVLHDLAKGKYWWHIALAIPYLLSKGADINAKDNDGLTPLHIALGGPDGQIGAFHKDAVVALLEGNANVNEHDGEGHSCLSRAVGDASLLNLILDRHVSVEADTLFMAIRLPHAESVRVLLKAGADPNKRRKIKKTPSEGNIQSNDTGRQHQLDRDVPVSEEYPLYYAATHHGSQDRFKTKKQKHSDWSNTHDIMQQLLISGADPYATFKRLTPNGLRVDSDEDGEDESVRDLLREGRISREQIEEVILVHDLLEHGDMVHPILSLSNLDADRRDVKGRSLLHMACHKYDLNAPIDCLSTVAGIDGDAALPSFLGCLLARGADPLAVDNTGNNVLHHMFLSNQVRTSSENDPATITKLANLYPTLVNQVNIHGRTPLHMALKHATLHGNVGPAEALLAAGADPAVIDNKKNGCLHTLAFSIYSDASVRSLFTRLLKLGLDINGKNERGETPIFNLNKDLSKTYHEREAPLAATEALLFFLEEGADLFATNNNGSGLLHVAAKETKHAKNPRLARLERWPEEPPVARFQALIAQGLDPLLEDLQQRTALDIAAACGKQNILDLFERK